MPSDLWNFALALYARPGVEQACLRAQDAGANVCLLLCAAWLDARGEPWSEARQARLQSLAQAHEQAVVAPLRALRRDWREAAATDPRLHRLREELKQLELHAERVLCERLQDCCVSWPPDEGAGNRGGWLARLAEEADLRALLAGGD